MNKIDQKIVGYKIVKKEENSKSEIEIDSEIDDSSLSSVTYKFKVEDDSYYVHLTSANNKPYSIFINSKCVEHLEAIGAITTLVSLLFQYNAPYDKIAKALDKMISSGKQAYWGKNYEHPNKKRNYHSIYQEIAEIVRHFIRNLNKDESNLNPKFEELPVYEEQLVEVALEKAKTENITIYTHVCSSCGEKKAILMDGCITCVGGCGFSKCG
jgi:hypothetical protein